jgi:hypothetical protein
MKEKAINALKRAISIPQRTFDHFKGKIQRVNEIRRERDQEMQHQLDVDMGTYKEKKDPRYITVPPPRRHDVMSVGKRIIK